MLSEWRWEFLRRRPVYQADFSKPDEQFLDESKGRFFERVYSLREPVDFLLGCLDIRRQEKERQSLQKRTTNRANIGALFPISFDGTVRFIDGDLSSGYSPPAEFDDRLRSNLKPHHLVLRIDLLKPIDAQLDELRPVIERGQRSWNSGRLIKVKAHKRLWPTYLRALDARIIGASYDEISQILPGHVRRDRQSARDVLKAALRLRDHWPF